MKQLGLDYQWCNLQGCEF